MALIVLGIVAVAAIAAAVAITWRLTDLLNRQEIMQREERHALTSRVQAPSILPPAAYGGPRKVADPPKDAREFASIGTVSPEPPSDG